MDVGWAGEAEREGCGSDGLGEEAEGEGGRRRRLREGSKGPEADEAERWSEDNEVIGDSISSGASVGGRGRERGAEETGAEASGMIEGIGTDNFAERAGDAGLAEGVKEEAPSVGGREGGGEAGE